MRCVSPGPASPTSYQFDLPFEACERVEREAILQYTKANYKKTEKDLFSPISIYCTVHL